MTAGRSFHRRVLGGVARAAVRLVARHPGLRRVARAIVVRTPPLRRFAERLRPPDAPPAPVDPNAVYRFRPGPPTGSGDGVVTVEALFHLSRTL